MALTDNFLIIYVAVICAILYRLIKCFVRISRLPPGPWGVPILGYIPWLSESVHKDFVEIGKKYGGMFSITLGSDTIVVLNDWPTIKKTLIERAKIFSGRYQNHLTTLYSDNLDISFGDGEMWKKQRNLVIQGMKFVGMSKKSVEVHLTNMIDNLIEKLTQNSGNEFYLETLLSKALSQVNWKLLSSFDVADNEDEMKAFQEDINDMEEGFGASNPLGMFPWLRFVPPNGFGYWKFKRSVIRLKKQLSKVIKKHTTMLPSDDSIIAYHIHRYQDLPKEPPYQVEYLNGTVMDLFAASYDAVLASTLTSFFYLCQHFDVQQKIQQELDDVVGRYRMPCLTDLKQLQYLEAVVLELHRIGTIAPLALPHKTMQTVEIDGYVLPKGTVFFQNTYAVHYDPRLWNEPEKFQPERFFNQENKISVPPYLIPFSIGPRMCPGKEFAEMELRLLYARLLHKFTFSFPKNRPAPTLKTVIRATVMPHPYLLVANPRN